MDVDIVRQLLTRLQKETGAHYTVVLIPHDKSHPVVTGSSDIPAPNDVKVGMLPDPIVIDDAVQYAHQRRL